MIGIRRCTHHHWIIYVSKRSEVSSRAEDSGRATMEI